MTRRSLHAAVVPLLLSLCPATASAQTPASEPASASAPATEPPATPKPRGNGALFGGTDSTSNARPLALDATLSVSSAYDDDLSEGRSATPFQAPVGGEYTDASGGLSLVRKGLHSRVTARASTSLRHYPSLHRFVASTHSAGADINVDVTRKTAVRASVDGTYVSEFAFDTVSRQSGLGNISLSASGLDIAALDGARLSYGAAAGLAHKVGMRSMFSVTVGGRDSERRLINEKAAERSVGGYFSRNIGRDTSVGFGYNLRSSSQRLGVDARPAWSNDVQAGIERRWRHSRERRTVLSMSAGPSLLRTEEVLPLAARPDQPTAARRFNLVGAVALNHDMSRSWNLGTSYRRGSGSIDGMVSDAASFELRGLLSRRVELAISGGYLETDLGPGWVQSRYTTKYGSGRLQVALTRDLAFYGQYVLYDYDFGSGSPLALGLPPQQQRRGARVGLTLWMPLHEGR